jgi:hypothetical protein
LTDEVVAEASFNSNRINAVSSEDSLGLSFADEDLDFEFPKP